MLILQILEQCLVVSVLYGLTYQLGSRPIALVQSSPSPYFISILGGGIGAKAELNKATGMAVLPSPHFPW